MNHKNLLLSLFSCLLLLSCSKHYQRYASRYAFKTENGVPEYGNLAYWAAHPEKNDPSDSIPAPLLADFHQDTTADVFFIHPTTYTDVKKTMGSNALVDDALLNAKTDYSTILLQASIFNTAGRIYAPRYRQAHISCYFPQTAADSAAAKAAFEMAYQDVKTAFLYYLQHENHHRPIIIAAHSQGTTHAIRLLAELFDNQPLQQQLVAAYLIGMGVNAKQFQLLKPCQQADETGCLISWRTYKVGYVPPFVQIENYQALVINPLTWDAAKPTADRDSNKGGILLNFNKMIPKITDANIHEGILWVHKPHFFGNLFYTTKNYHVGDLNLFYLNIRENAQHRVAAFRQKKGL